MNQNEWCWLNKTIRGDTKVVVELQFAKPEGFQICINAKEELQRWKNNEENPAGYSCWFGKWDGSMDFIGRNEEVCKTDFNGLLVSSLTGMRGCSLTFMREDDKVSLLVNDKEVHHETYLVPLFGKHVGKRELGESFEHIGIRTSGTNVRVSKITAYRRKLAEKPSPTVAGDALVEAGDLEDALEKYKMLASDYKESSPSISALALTKGYLLAEHLKDSDSRNSCYQALNELERQIRSDWLASWLHPECAKYREKEADTLRLWKERQYLDALDNLPGIFKANPTSRIVIECLQSEHKPLEPRLSEELLAGTAKTFDSGPELAGLDINSFQITNLDPIKSIRSLRSLDCSRNRLASLDPLREMKQLSALYCGDNHISTLEPIKAPNLFWLYCNDNQIESLEPLNPLKMLNTLYCGKNRIKDLSPLNGKLQALNCSDNQISSLEPISRLPELSLLCCRANQISSIEPVRQAKNLRYLDCSLNAVQTLEPLKDLPLEAWASVPQWYG